ncbi:UNVERIFIED_CONTAM: hypothetical protein Scaly_3124800 [Sesamum calycinum]|uniref:Uncharacterized protein n=3 Tax=Sesamum TaxID=4181 RepID=A0AAW2JIB5_9LAMI
MTRGKRREARKRTVPIKGSRTKATNGIDLNGNTGSFAGEEFGSDFEEDIPSRVFSAYAINAGTEFSSGIERNDGVFNEELRNKKDGRIRVCVDYRDFPKDDFPHIDVLVDSAASYAMYEFMDVTDKLKTALTTAWGTYCYTVMLFGSKNAGATYQRMATARLHDMIGKEEEVDDMMVKSDTREGHFEALDKFLTRIRKVESTSESSVVRSNFRKAYRPYSQSKRHKD